MKNELFIGKTPLFVLDVNPMECEWNLWSKKTLETNFHLKLLFQIGNNENFTKRIFNSKIRIKRQKTDKLRTLFFLLIILID